MSSPVKIHYQLFVIWPCLLIRQCLWLPSWSICVQSRNNDMDTPVMCSATPCRIASGKARAFPQPLENHSGPTKAGRMLRETRQDGTRAEQGSGGWNKAAMGQGGQNGMAVGWGKGKLGPGRQWPPNPSPLPRHNLMMWVCMGLCQQILQCKSKQTSLCCRDFPWGMVSYPEENNHNCNCSHFGVAASMGEGRLACDNCSMYITKLQIQLSMACRSRTKTHYQCLK